MAEKLTRMKADTFRARLRLGLGFDGPVHVPEKLAVCDRNVEHLCDAICVDGDLNLSGCSNLESLPERLVVRGQLSISGCARITRLPQTVRELFGFKAVGCSDLKSITPLVECRGTLDLRGCESLDPLPPDFTAVGLIKLDGIRIDENSVFVQGQLPETIRQASIGKRIGDVVRHRILAGHRILDTVITDAFEMKLWDGVVFCADTSPMIIPSKPD